MAVSNMGDTLQHALSRLAGCGRQVPVRRHRATQQPRRTHEQRATCRHARLPLRNYRLPSASQYARLLAGYKSFMSSEYAGSHGLPAGQGCITRHFDH